MNTLVVIPARGGSKGIPNKNLRPMRGKPLIAWVLEAALGAKGVDAVVVSTDSEAIATVARRFGAEVVMRPPELGADHVTLDPVIHDAVAQLERAGERYDLVLTVQPTSPTLRRATIEAVVRSLAQDRALDTVITAVEDRHLAWADGDGQGMRPLYTARVNRQQLPSRYRETGGVLATRREHVRPDSRIGPALGLHLLGQHEGIDIDSHEDWAAAEAALGRKRIAFLVIGNRKQGLGHVTRAMALLECMTGHDVRVFVDPAEDLALELLWSRSHKVEVVSRSLRLEALRTFAPDVVVHDELDTSAEDLYAERAMGARVVTFEDLGAGPEIADLVVNELYEPR